MWEALGKTVFKGIAIGKIKVFNKEQASVAKRKIDDIDGEERRVKDALNESKQQLKLLYDKAVQETGKAGAAVFEAHRMMLEDNEYLSAVYNRIRSEAVNAEYAVEVTGDYFQRVFSNLDDEYMKARAADVKDISDRLIRNLKGKQNDLFEIKEPSIIVANDLTPSEIIQMDKKNILAMVTVHGSTNSHTAILAGMMNIPALIGMNIDLNRIYSGMQAIVDGFQGKIIFEPEEETFLSAKKQMLEEAEKKRLFTELKGRETVTPNGQRVRLYANIRSVSDIGAVLENDAEGIGLFRSEFLYLGRDTSPSEKEQFQAYKQVLQAMEGKKVIIRTLDMGADKQAAYLGLEKEENPALGYRGIRICLKQPEIFKTQLRALFRAAVFGNLSVMYPMIIAVEEVEQIKGIVETVKEELEKSKIPYRIPEQGIMIETPAAVMLSDELAQMVDFFSIGTNDLTQYALAVDRQNEKLESYYNPRNEAVLRMIQMTAEHAHQHGKWVGICGELGADVELTERFLQMGIDELSVSPSMILKVRKKIRETTNSL